MRELLPEEVADESGVFEPGRLGLRAVYERFTAPMRDRRPAQLVAGSHRTNHLR